MPYLKKAEPRFKHPKKKLLFAVLAGLVIVSLLAGGWLLQSKRNNTSPAQAGTKAADSIKYAPATPQEKQQAEDRKDEIIRDQAKAEEAANAPKTSSGKKAVTPVITYATYKDGMAEIQAYIPGLFEDGGSCTLTLTQASQTVTKQVPALANVSTTDCQRFNVPRADFPASGTWKVIINYSSTTAEGASSQNTTLEVQ